MNLNFLVQLEKSPSQSLEMLKNEEITPCHAHEEKWFKVQREEFKNYSWWWRPSTRRSEVNVEQVITTGCGDLLLRVRMITCQLDMKKRRICKITIRLGISEKWWDWVCRVSGSYWILPYWINLSIRQILFFLLFLMAWQPSYTFL